MGGGSKRCAPVRERENKREEERKEIWRWIEEGTVGEKERVHALTQWEARGKTCVMSSALPRIINMARALGRQSKASSGPRFVERLLIRVEDEIIHGRPPDGLCRIVHAGWHSGTEHLIVEGNAGKSKKIGRRHDGNGLASVTASRDYFLADKKITLKNLYVLS